MNVENKTQTKTCMQSFVVRTVGQRHQSELEAFLSLMKHRIRFLVSGCKMTLIHQEPIYSLGFNNEKYNAAGYIIMTNAL